MGSCDFVPWRWLRKRELGNQAVCDENTSLYNQLYLSLQVVNTFEPNKTTNHSHHGGIFNFDYSTDGSILVAACEKQSILMFDPFNGKLIDAKDEAHEDCVNCVRFLDTRIFATCSDDTTVALWDARYLKQKIRTFHGHSNWVKNIEYASGLGLLVTSGFDGSIFTWDINSYSNEEFSPHKVFHTGALMRSKLTPDNSQLVISTAVGYLIIIHNLDLHTLAEDLSGFKPTLYRQMQISQLDNSMLIEYNHVFERTRNRVEFISDFPHDNQAEVISSLQIHPQGWCAVSRNTNAREKSEWTCVHDIQTLPKPDKEDSENSLKKEPVIASCSASGSVQENNSQSTRANGPHLDIYVNSYENLGCSINKPKVLQDFAVDDDNDDDDDDDDSESSDDFPLITVNGFGSSHDFIHMRRSESSNTPPPLETNDHSLSDSLIADGFSISARSDEPSVDVVPDPLHLHNNIPFVPFENVFAFRTSSLLRRRPRKRNKNVCQNTARLLAFTEEPNVGRGFIKELCFSSDGRLICSPFGNGVRLLTFDPNCNELCDNVPTSAVRLYELGSSISHSDVVVTTKFSPVHCLYVSGCLSGKIAFNQPRL